MQTKNEKPRIIFQSQLQIVGHLRSMNEPLTVQHFRDTLGDVALPLTHPVIDNAQDPNNRVELYSLLKQRVEEDTPLFNYLFETHGAGLKLKP